MTHDVTLVVLQSVFVRTMVLPEQLYESGQVTVSVTPVPLLHCVVELPGPLKTPVYRVVCDGVTEVEPFGPTAPTPLIVPPVVFVDVHESAEDCPRVMLVGFSESVQAGFAAPTVMVSVAYVAHEV